MLRSNKLRKLLAAGSVVTMAFTSLVAISTQTASAEEGTYVFLPKSLNNPYWVDCKKGMDSAVAKLGVKAQFLGPENDDAAAQVKIFESVLATKPLGIAISPNDPASVKELIAKAVAQGIPVIAWDGPVPGSEVSGYVGTNNTAAGTTLGKEVAKGIKNEGEVGVVIGSLSAVNLKQRLDGVKLAFKKFPKIKIVAIQESNESVAEAQTAAETMLQAHPKIKAFVGIGGSDLPGIAGALKAAGKPGKVQAYGFDVVPQGIAAMKAGYVNALVSQRPFGMTAQALQILKDFHDKTSKLPKNFNIDTGVQVVTPKTLATFLKTPA